MKPSPQRVARLYLEARPSRNSIEAWSDGRHMMVFRRLPDGIPLNQVDDMAAKIQESAVGLIKSLQGQGFTTTRPGTAKLHIKCPGRHSDPTPSVVLSFQVGGEIKLDDAGIVSALERHGWHVDKDNRLYLVR